MGGTFNCCEYAGKHLILDIWNKIGEELLCNSEAIKEILEASAVDAGATVLGSQFHHFGEGCGITGTIALSESHISIHTWPERGLSTIDIYMCGKCNPEDSLPRILEAFSPLKYQHFVIKRGMMDIDMQR